VSPAALLMYFISDTAVMPPIYVNMYNSTQSMKTGGPCHYSTARPQVLGWKRQPLDAESICKYTERTVLAADGDESNMKMSLY
jgi:hypothetical protein